MSNRNGQYQIIATLGPAVKNRVEQLVAAGATGFRINCAHITLAELSRWLLELEHVFRKRGDAMPVWLDLQGSKLRIGRLAKVNCLQRGDVITFRNQYSQIDNEIPLPCPAVFRRIKPGDSISLDDGKIHLAVQQVNNGSFQAEVVNFGEISSFKSFILNDNDLELDQVSDRDRLFIEQTRHWRFIGYAISYLQNTRELSLFQQLLTGKPIAVKIERPKAFLQLRELANLSDMTWLCRGDLGAIGSIYQLFEYEKKFIQHMVLIQKPALIAGQVLENMVRQNYPSRSEIAHLGYLLENGFSGIVLSDETAIGKYPIEAVEFCRNFIDYIGK